MNFFFQSLLPPLVISLLFAGCATTRPAPEPETQPALVLGTVLHVDARQELAVVSLHPNARLTESRLYSRNPALSETSRLEAAAQRRGRMLGVRILSGLPNPGDEVLVAPKEKETGGEGTR